MFDEQHRASKEKHIESMQQRILVPLLYRSGMDLMKGMGLDTFIGIGKMHDHLKTGRRIPLLQ